MDSAQLNNINALLKSALAKTGNSSGENPMGLDNVSVGVVKF